MHGLDDLVPRRLERARGDHFGDKLSGIAADNVATKQLAILGIVDDLDEALGMAECRGFTRSREGEFADFQFVARFLGGLLRIADRSNLRLAVGGAGDAEAIERLDIPPGNFLDADYALVAGFVREPRCTGYVANGIDALDVSAVELIDYDRAALGLHADLLEAEVLDVAHDADGGKHLVALDHFHAFLRLNVDLERFALGVDLLHLGRGHRLDALLLEGAGELFGDILILNRHDAIHQLDDGYFRAHVVVEVAKLDTDCAGAANDETLRRRLLEHGFAVRDDFLAVDRQGRDLPRARTGGNDDMLGADLTLFADLLAVHVLGRLDRDLAFAGDTCAAVDDVDLVLLHQELDALVHLARHVAASLDDLVKLGRNLTLKLESVRIQIARVFKHFGATQQRLGRDTADVQADAAQLILLDDRCLETEMRGPDSRLVATWSRSDHDDIVLIILGHIHS